MTRTILTATLTALVFSFAPAAGQAGPEPIPSEQQVKKLPRQKLSGPRFGLTAFTGETKKGRDYLGLSPVMSQIGWQFETQMVSTETGSQALMEWLVLVGGFESSEFNMSLAWLAGYRLPNGFEVGAGPAASYNPELTKFTTSIQMALGATLGFGDVYLPLNLGVGFAEGGPRITTLIGWIVG
jgi:hypothetical protein